MNANHLTGRRSLLLYAFIFAISCIFAPIASKAQIYEPEGLNMPGAWNGWSNPPSNLAFASSTQVSGGRVVKISSGTPRWQTSFSVAATGGDITSGTYQWLFTSGASSSPWNNKWGGVTVTMNSLQDYTYSSGAANNSVTVSNGKWYTVNWKDAGYANTQAVFMETGAQPVSLASVSVPSNVQANQATTITLILGTTPSAEEKFYLRYSTDSWNSSSTLVFTMTGSTGSATIPGLPGGTDVKYYAFSSTVSGLSGNYDLFTLKYNNNGGLNYSYQVAGVSSEANILSFTLPQQTAAAVINTAGATVSISVPYGTSLTSLTPAITVSTGATINPASGTAQNFSAPFHYLVTAQDGTTTRDWTVTVSVTPVVIGWVNLQWPPNGTCEPGQPFNVYGQIWINGHTGGSTAFPPVQAWVGYHSQNTDPATWTNWIPASFNGPVGNNDEYTANLGAAMTTNGTYYYAMRYSVDGTTYVYGGYQAGSGGFWDGTTNVSGILTVGYNINCSEYNGVAYSSPGMARDNESITVYFDATKGNAALLNFTHDVYAHTAVLTNLSSGPSDWKYIKSNWGVNSPETKMTRVSANLYSLTINTPRSYYNVPSGELIQKMVFVFRSDSARSGGNYLEHRNADGSDIAVTIYNNPLAVKFNNPTGKQTILNQSTTLPVCVSALGNSSLSLYVNSTLLKQQASSGFSYMLIMSQLQSGTNWLKAVATNGVVQARDSVEIYLRGPLVVAELPSGAHNGINYVNDSTVTLVMHDPTGYKQYVYVIGDFNNWSVSDAGYMKRTSDGKRYWITLSGITAGQEYAYQYYVDGDLRLADPYAEKVLDPWNDQWIPASHYPNLKSYPNGSTDGVVSIFQTARPAYNWQVPDFVPPALNNSQSDMVIYELLLRDFTGDQSLAAAQEKLDYLKDLGVNVVELMPVMEYDGNDSWGYSTNFFLAADKYYGTRENLKAFIDAAHQKGIAVVMDIVVNHAFGLNPMVKLYWNSATNQPSDVNPWFNQQSPHPYSVGYDFNHESGHTRQFFKDVFQYWLNEYKVDGFRLDLSKGLTQNYSGSDLGAWNAYDQSRINILNDYKAHIKWVKPNAYVILEHFANNDEETVLANSGFLLWSAMHNNYKQVAMGWQTNSDVSWAFHGNRGWSYPNLVDYMETHDEERMLYEALNNGNSTNPTYDLKYFYNGLHHQEQGIVLFMGIPGPKMLYEFQEMGYDYSKFYGGSNVSPKPPRWDYLNVPEREKLSRVVSAMAKLRKSDAFRYGNFYSDLSQNGKKIWITHSSMDVIISVNMGVNGFVMAPGFTHAGTWYNYFTGEAVTVTDPGGHYFNYNPGDYTVFTSQPLAKPFHNLTVTVVDSLTGTPIQGATVSLLNSGNRTTGSNGQASFTALPQRIYVTAEKFGWLNRTVDTLISANTSVTIALSRGWDPSAGWVNLQSPAAGSIQPGADFNVYARTWIRGVTSQALQDTTIHAWIGFSTENTSPATWTNWIPASYFTAVGDNDEYVANLGNVLTTDGTYYFASRFSKDEGTYAYGGYSGSGGGFWNGSTNVSGVVQVSTVGQPMIGWATLEHPGTGYITPGQAFNVYGQAWIENITGQSTPASGLQCWVGYSTSNTNPSTWTNWVLATYNGAAGNNDRFTADLGASVSVTGTYYYAFRFKYNTQAYVYGGYSGSGGGFWDGVNNVNGTLTVSTTLPTAIQWANLQWPGTGSIDAAQEFNVYGQAYVAGMTGQPVQLSGLQAWVGYSLTNTDPSSWTTWIPATYNVAVGNNDEFYLNLGQHITSGGTYYYAYRYSLNNGSYYYGGYSAGGGDFWDGTQYVSGVLTVTSVNKTLNLKVYLEGLYAGSGLMNKAQGEAGDQYPGTIADKVTVELHNASVYNSIVYSATNLDLNTDGTLSLTIPPAFSGSYYITVRHRNSIETTTATPVSFSGSSMSFDFSSSASNAYGDNMRAADGYYLIYGGDVNQDGIVDATDMIEVDNDSSTFATGYISNDANGDGIIDATDMILVDNNSGLFIGIILP